MSPRRAPAALAVLVLVSAVRAQTSASYKLTESTLNSGGDPANGSYAASSSWRIKLDAIGDAVLAVGLGSASYHVDAGFVDVYPPPGEIQQVLFSDKQTFRWRPEKSVGRYETYRNGLNLLPGGDAGVCLSSGLTTESAVDASSPATGQGYFYLITARNRINEEGTKGYRSNGTERPNVSPCP